MRKCYQTTAIVIAAAFAVGLLSSCDIGYAAKKGKLHFSKSVELLGVGESYTFKVAGQKKKEKDHIIWSSSDPKIAKINKKGKVMARKAGIVTIMAKIEGSKQSVKQKLQVATKEEDQQEHQENTENQIEDQKIPFKEQKVENDFVTNLSEEAEKVEVNRSNTLFTDYKDINDFCYSVFKNVAAKKEKNENPVVSPLSAYFALVLTSEGARNNTKTEFNHVLGKEFVAERVYQLTESLSKISGNTQLSIADSVWIDDTFDVDSSWLSKMTSFYHADIYQADLCTDEARTGINHWTNNQTKGLIPTLLDKNLSEEARLALINTIYLKTKWSDSFKKENTYEREFTNENGKTVKTDFMNDNGYKSYFKTEDADGLILPYDDNKLSFFAIRPQAGQTARELAQSLTGEKLTSYLENAKFTNVAVHLPKYTFDYSITMNDILKTMGLHDVFDAEKANLTGLGTADENLYISEVLQKVKVKVEEEGTEAAAVTLVDVNTGTAFMPEEEKPLEVDFHEPFVYVIADKETLGEETETVPLFLGIVTEFSE